MRTGKRIQDRWVAFAAVLLAPVLALSLLLSACAPASEEPLPDAPIIGVGWRPNQKSTSYVNTLRALDELGYRYVLLPQAQSGDLEYDQDKMLLEGVAETGALSEDAAALVRANTWHGSDAEEILQGISAVLFPGGEDISPSLYADPQPWHGIEKERDYSAERDVSDYILMSYCLDKEIPFLAVCRGCQMLNVVSGGTVIQDIGTWLEGQGLTYHDQHRATIDAEGHHDFAPNHVSVEANTYLHEILGCDEFDGGPCWHHQAIQSVEGTPLVVSATTQTEGVTMIEGIERTDKDFAVGVQFHPETAVQRTLDQTEDAASFMDYDLAMSLFERLEQECVEYYEQEQALPAAA